MRYDIPLSEDARQRLLARFRFLIGYHRTSGSPNPTFSVDGIVWSMEEMAIELEHLFSHAVVLPPSAFGRMGANERDEDSGYSAPNRIRPEYVGDHPPEFSKLVEPCPMCEQRDPGATIVTFFDDLRKPIAHGVLYGQHEVDMRRAANKLAVRKRHG